MFGNHTSNSSIGSFFWVWQKNNKWQSSHGYSCVWVYSGFFLTFLFILCIQSEYDTWPKKVDMDVSNRISSKQSEKCGQKQCGVSIRVCSNSHTIVTFIGCILLRLLSSAFFWFASNVSIQIIVIWIRGLQKIIPDLQEVRREIVRIE